ncbi:MAG: hypothetical protein BGO09_14705 [Bacteroidetes bacterium 47-18]|nr:MAG: hypothetical protein BGO09_14705 [Bacteroidetes bacterium 47-18]
MKNIILSIILSLCYFYGYSDSRGIAISNESRCDIYLQVLGTKECNTCQKQYISDVIVIPGGGTATYLNTTTLGGNFPAIPAYIHSVRILSGPRHCRMQAWYIGEPACSFPTAIAFFTRDENCRIICERLRAEWHASQSSRCEGIARLVIAP